MARRTLQRRSNQGRRRANRGWTGTIAATPVLVPAASKVLLATFILDNDGIDETILRTVGGISIQSDQASSGESQIGAFGLTIINDVAGALGVTGIPDPVSEVADDVWFTYVPFASHITVSSAVGFSAQGGNYFAFDSRAKRILESGYRVAAMVANSSASHGFFATLVMRMLTQVRGTG